MGATAARSATLSAALWMGLAILSFCAMAVAIRELTAGLSAFQILFVRSAMGLLFLCALSAIKGWRPYRTARPWGHVQRNAVHFAGQTLWIISIGLLPLATVFSIEFTTPLWGALLAVLFLKERMNRGRLVALVLGFIGILVILQPGSGGLEEALLLMVLCAFFFGATTVYTKWLTRSDEAITILFYMTLLQMIFGFFASLFVWQPIAWTDWPWLFAVAVTGLTAHLGIAKALSHADATVVLPMDFVRLPLIALVGFLIYHENPGLMTWVGAALIVAGNYYGLTQETALKKSV